MCVYHAVMLMELGVVDGRFVYNNQRAVKLCNMYVKLVRSDKMLLHVYSKAC